MIAWGLGYFGMPHILLRFMAIEDEEKLKLSRRVATGWVVISLAVAVLIGIIGLAMTAAGELIPLEGSASETIIVKIADLMSQHGVLPALLAGTILAGILASTMSTADSQLLAASSSVSSDLLGDFSEEKDRKERVDVCGSYYPAYHCTDCSLPCKRSEQFCFQYRIFCMGRLRCCIRTGCPLCIVLETF